ncbi:hypothetical protein BDV97DRAFT_159354 [Delphinella strobiligena]|nr:hypothetical protein BDV97DRAFT_159354 [Delphinella strobiligena]
MVFALNLDEHPKHHPDCCVAISRPFLLTLLDLFPTSPSLVLSIGSGTGYLESSLLQLAGDDSLNLIGLEVSSEVNKYLPEQNFISVSGTWDLYPGASKASVFLFVYPREPRLLARYIQQFGHLSCEKIVWIGPSLDWPDYQGVLVASGFTSITNPSNSGMADYEMVSVATRA